MATVVQACNRLLRLPLPQLLKQRHPAAASTKADAHALSDGWPPASEEVVEEVRENILEEVIEVVEEAQEEAVS